MIANHAIVERTHAHQKPREVRQRRRKRLVVVKVAAVVRLAHTFAPGLDVARPRQFLFHSVALHLAISGKSFGQLFPVASASAQTLCQARNDHASRRWPDAMGSGER